MGSVNLQLLHLTDQLNPTMKFLLIASLFVLSALAEPEAEADAQYGVYGGYYPMSYGYNRGYGYNNYNGYNSYNGYNMYNRNFWGQRRYVREADAEYYNWNRGYGYSPYSMSYGYSGYPYNRYNNYNSYNRNFNYNSFNGYYRY